MLNPLSRDETCATVSITWNLCECARGVRRLSMPRHSGVSSLNQPCRSCRRTLRRTSLTSFGMYRNVHWCIVCVLTLSQSAQHERWWQAQDSVRPDGDQGCRSPLCQHCLQEGRHWPPQAVCINRCQGKWFCVAACAILYLSLIAKKKNIY